jgi:hypothetical protein
LFSYRIIYDVGLPRNCFPRPEPGFSSKPRDGGRPRQAATLAHFSVLSPSQHTIDMSIPETDEDMRVLAGRQLADRSRRWQADAAV